MRSRFAMLSAAMLSAGCVMAYLPSMPIPGRFHPETRPFGVELALGVDVGRNVATGVDVDRNGVATAGAVTNAQWPGADLALRVGITDWLGLEGRVTGSMIFPMPLPIPNGLGLAPIIRVAEPMADVKLFTSPRFVTVDGQAIIVLTNDLKQVDKRHGLGAELPVMVTWDPVEWFGLTGTAFARGLSMTGTSGETASEQGPPYAWSTFGYGLSVQATLTGGPFRLGLGGGWEAVPDPGYDLAKAACHTQDCALPAPWNGVWQVGLTLALKFN